ncbi:helix-turn-helix transcriptional regulator [Natrinema sp. SYSU A 869]|uniref:helix-turn-helix transcriptional regulator n=1 Tax=Natrinema sp. SYSU A 869 TaxID=2871694 RepID=UPI001CA3E81A|nr:helix-turn-helix transcriptional regulator [Natrinema sp. SYSU A 869]
MHDNDSRDLENPARADASPHNQLVTDGGEPSDTSRSSSDLHSDGGTRWTDLTAFQCDCLEAVARLERDDKRSHEAEIVRELEHANPELNRNRLYPNLTVLVGHGLLKRRERSTDDRVEYVPTAVGQALLRARVERLAETCELVVLDRTDDATARGAGDG